MMTVEKALERVAEMEKIQLQHGAACTCYECVLSVLAGALRNKRAPGSRRRQLTKILGHADTTKWDVLMGHVSDLRALVGRYARDEQVGMAERNRLRDVLEKQANELGTLRQRNMQLEQELSTWQKARADADYWKSAAEAARAKLLKLTKVLETLKKELEA